MAMSTAQVPGIGSLLKHYRQVAGLTQEALAEKAGLSVRGIQDLERGVSRTPRPDTIDLLATALGLDTPDCAKLVAAAGRQPHSPTRPNCGTRRAPASLVPLVGRGRELALLEQCLAGEEDGLEATPVLLLAGEPGVGKTRLLEVAAQRAIGQGWRVLVGGCHRRGGQEPYAPVLEALARHLDVLAQDRLLADLAGCAWLVRLLPELVGVLEPLPAGLVPAEQERRLMFAAVARFLANVAGPAGTLLVLDDLQWAGPDALDLLATLLHLAGSGHPQGLRLRVVGAYRDTEVGPSDPFGLLLADLAQGGLVRQQALSPLNWAEAASLLADLLVDVGREGHATIEHILERAEGTPFFLVSYAQALKQGSTEAVPWNLAQGVRERVALVPVARDVLGAAAIIGRRVPRALLAAVMGQPEEAVLAGLEAACKARLLLEEGEDAYVFAHDLIREVVEADLGAARRALLHRKVAEALERQGGGAPAELLAYHFGHSLAYDKAADYLERAGDQAREQYAYDRAERHYRELLERLQTLSRELDMPRVWEKLGELLHQAGRYAEALPLLEQASEAYRKAGDPEGEVRTTACIARAHARGGAPEIGITRVTELVERLDRSDASPALAALHGALGQLLLFTGRYAEASTANRQAAKLARDSDDDRTRLEAEGNRAHILIKLGRMDEALGLAQQVLHLTEELGDLHLIAGLHRDLAFNLAAQGAFEIARMHIERASVVARHVGDPWELMMAVAVGGWLAFLRGDWPEARADLEQAMTLSSQGGPSWHATYPPLFLAHLCLAEGDWPAASAAGNRALALAEQSGDLQGLRWTSRVIAELDIQEGRADVALGRLLPLLDRPGLEEGDVTDFLPVLAWAYLEKGQLNQAREVVAQALSRARAERAKPLLTEAVRVHALIALHQGERHVADCSLKEGLGLALAMPYPYAEARLLQLDGERLAAKGEPVGARERLEEALAIFRRLGARKEVERTEQALARLGRALVPAST